MQAVAATAPQGSGTGVAWAIGTYYGHRCFSHSGGMPGVATWIRAYPDDGLATIVLTNTDRRTLAEGVTSRLAAAFFPEGEPPGRVRRERPPNDPSGFLGLWRGKLVHFDGDITVLIDIKDKDTVRITLGAASAEARQITFNKDRFTGSIDATIRTQDSYHGVPTIDFRLRRVGNRMTGTAVALGSGYFALSHWVELTREP